MKRLLIMAEPIMEKRLSRPSLIVYFVLSIVVLGAIGMPLIQSNLIYPSFVDQLLKSSETNALRMGNHMMHKVLEGYDGDEFTVTPNIQEYIDGTKSDFDLWKIKIFSRSGGIIYSTSEEDIGTTNDKPYFHNIVAKGRTYAKIVKKNTKSLEGVIVENDVVETYVPMMRGEVFVGAFEIYSNITVRKRSMDRLIAQFNYLIWALTILIIFVVVITILLFKNSMNKRVAFENTLKKMAVTDNLTDVYNRRGFEKLIENEMIRSKRYNRDASLLMFDLDHFKRVNDQYGHLVGDEVLIDVSRRCKAIIRKCDIIGRYGGEEFVIFLPEIGRHDVVLAAERLRKTIEQNPISTIAGIIRVTASVGVTSFSGGKGLSVETLIKRADDALYKAKKRGRNQVVYGRNET